MPTLLHFSTDEVYGDIVSGAHKETDLLKPSNPYSATKAAADQLILAWNRTYQVPYNIVRPTNNYGIGQYVEKLIPKVCKFLSIGRKIPLHNNGEPFRMWLHAKDTAEAVIKIIESGKMSGCDNWQLMFQVLIPTARRDILIGVNQVIMVCFSMAVISAFIAAKGLGYNLLLALNLSLINI